MPETVLEEAKETLLQYKDTGVGLLEMSHRSKPFQNILEEAQTDLKSLLEIGDDFEVLFFQGGASLQFHLIPLNLSVEGSALSYMNTGTWSKKAISEAKRLGEVNVLASSDDKNFSYIPALNVSEDLKKSSYLHYTSNNTIVGTQFKEEPLLHEEDKSLEQFLVCDASSDFLSRPLNTDRYGMLYAGAQKNLGPSGVTVVVIRKTWLERSHAALPPMLSYANQAKHNSLFNTPCTFSIYVLGRVLKWVKQSGGLLGIQKQNEEKAALLYQTIDDSNGFFRGTAEKESRSLMNVTFRLPSEELETLFFSEASNEGFSGLKGHRSVGGVRASIYNAFPRKGVEALVSFMKAFSAKH